MVTGILYNPCVSKFAKNRRRHFLINKPLQLRYMFWVMLILLGITGILLTSVYYGISGYAVKEFSEQSIRNSLNMTSRLVDYEEARFGRSEEITIPRLAFVKETALFSERQREIVQEILIKTQKRILILCIPLLFFLGWGTIFISHKIAGPLYRFNLAFAELSKRNLKIRIHLRKHDEAQDIADTFNVGIETLDQAVSRIKKAVKDAPNRDQIPNAITDELSAFQTAED